jgi:uncharacterized protein (DUF4415 family)
VVHSRAYKAATAKPAEPLPKPPSLANAKELVSLRIDRDALDHFREGGPAGTDQRGAAQGGGEVGQGKLATSV